MLIPLADGRLILPRSCVAEVVAHSTPVEMPGAPNWYLGTVGTHPDHRRRGLAAAVVEPVLTRCDADGTVAFLETSSDDNVRGYRRLGFEVVFETVTSDGVLPLYVMHRTPVARAR